MPVRLDVARSGLVQQKTVTLAELNALIAASPPGVRGGTRAVLGEGPIGAAIALVGEQPGDQEDIQGRPFVGPAGRLLRHAMADAGIEASRTYITNAVKHFKFLERGKRRLHQKPTAGEIKHYRWWLLQEIELVDPRVVVALGASAVQGLTGKVVSIMRFRGATRFGGRLGVITVHPSHLLRLPDGDRAAAMRAFITDLQLARSLAAQAAALPDRDG